MRRLLLNGAGAKRKPNASQAVWREGARDRTPQGRAGRLRSKTCFPTVAIVAATTNGGDRQGDGGAKVDDGRAVETSSGEGPDRARQRQAGWRARA